MYVAIAPWILNAIIKQKQQQQKQLGEIAELIENVVVQHKYFQNVKYWVMKTENGVLL